MEAAETMTDKTPCGHALPDLEIPMINTMVMCLGSEHRKLNDLTMRLAFAATRLAADPKDVNATQRAVETWDEVRRDLWPHLQIEDELVFSWGAAHNAIPVTLLETLKTERQELHKLVASLPALSPDEELSPSVDHGAFARTLIALTQTLDCHVERYDGEVLPSILRALFKK